MIKSIFQPISNALISDAKLSATNSNFLIASMCTPSYRNLAIRLIDSIKQFNHLDFVLFETPTVHRSISPKGTENIEFCKPNFIAHCLSVFRKPILYLDCDVVIKKNPALIEEIVKSREVDFSIFNWLNDQDNAAYIPHKIKNGSDESITIYHISHSINYQSTDQLICSGAVQLWSLSEPALSLLSFWKSTIEKNNDAQDDHCLDYAFNNYQGEIKAHWLKKSYARYAWWIFDEPIIDHPQIPYGGSEFKELSTEDGTRRVYTDRLREKICGINIPHGYILNIESNSIFKIDENGIDFEKENQFPIWL